jgi:hypothetical protein
LWRKNFTTAKKKEERRFLFKKIRSLREYQLSLKKLELISAHKDETFTVLRDLVVLKLLSIRNLGSGKVFEEEIKPDRNNSIEVLKIEELLQTYQDIQANRHLYVNLTFEFVADPDVKFDEIKEEFTKATIKFEHELIKKYFLNFNKTIFLPKT